eukprot:scaffold32789_cov39-Attheya_sp.AAC.1
MVHQKERVRAVQYIAHVAESTIESTDPTFTGRLDLNKSRLLLKTYRAAVNTQDIHFAGLSFSRGNPQKY